MNNQNRSLKILLTLLVVGVWGLLLRPMVSPIQVAAQPSKQRTPQYALAIHYEKDRKTVVTIKPLLAPAPAEYYYTSFNKSELEQAIKAGVSKGWRLHTMTQSDHNISVLFEK